MMMKKTTKEQSKSSPVQKIVGNNHQYERKWHSTLGHVIIYNSLCHMHLHYKYHCPYGAYGKKPKEIQISDVSCSWNPLSRKQASGHATVTWIQLNTTV